MQHLLTLQKLLADLPRAELDAGEQARFRNGQALKTTLGEGLYAVFGGDGQLIGLGEARAAGELRPLRLVSASQAADKHPKTL